MLGGGWLARTTKRESAAEEQPRTLADGFFDIAQLEQLRADLRAANGKVYPLKGMVIAAGKPGEPHDWGWSLVPCNPIPLPPSMYEIGDSMSWAGTEVVFVRLAHSQEGAPWFEVVISTLDIATDDEIAAAQLTNTT